MQTARNQRERRLRHPRRHTLKHFNTKGPYEHAHDINTNSVFALVRSLDWTPAPGSDWKPRGFLDRCRSESRVLPLDVPPDIRSRGGSGQCPGPDYCRLPIRAVGEWSRGWARPSSLPAVPAAIRQLRAGHLPVCRPQCHRRSRHLLRATHVVLATCARPGK
jgi:hypothetical protein